jgi:arylsulfate sulfotransferase
MSSRLVAILLVLMALSFPSCSPESDDAVSQPEESGGGDISLSPGQTGAEDGPTVNAVQVYKNPNNHLSCTVAVTTDAPTDANLTVIGGGKSWTVASSSSGKSHTFPVLGMKADTEYFFIARLVDKNGQAAYVDIGPYLTEPLPIDFPPIQVRASDPTRMQPGVTFFNIYRYAPGRDNYYGLILGVDEHGDVVWYHRDDLLIMDFTPLASGRLAYNRLLFRTREIDMMGNQTNDWNILQVREMFFHHEITELPWNDLMVLSSESRQIDGYPALDGGTRSHIVIGDVVVQFDRDGKRIKRWSMFDYLDPLRTRPGFHSSAFWRTPYFFFDDPKDWTHGNTVIYDERDNSFIVSLRHQDWLVKIDMNTDEMVWRLGEDGDFTMLGDGRWPIHQHSPTILSNGDLMVYDNGNDRPLFSGDSFGTRIVQYTVDEVAMTVEQVWEYLGEQIYFAEYVGNVAQMENGNILISNGGIVSNPNLPVTDPNNRKVVQIIEVTYEPDPEVLFEIVIDDPNISGYSAFTAFRLPSLYR